MGIIIAKKAFQEHLKHNDLALFTKAICEKMERPPVPPVKPNKEEAWDSKYVTGLVQRCWSASVDERPDFQQIYDELNVIITEGYIKDDWGRQFWAIHFTDQDSAPWDEFVKNLMSSKTITLEDNTTYRGLAMSRKNPENAKIADCLQLLLSQIAGQRKSEFTRVSCDNFGKLLAWFGPGIEIDGKSHFKNFLERMAYICRQPWFWGLLSNPEQILHDGEKKVFLVRLSNDPGYFTIQTTSIKTRIVYIAGKGYKPETDNNYFEDLVDFINNHPKLKTFIPQEGSAFSRIFGTSADLQPVVNAGAYMTSDFLSRVNN